MEQGIALRPSRFQGEKQKTGREALNISSHESEPRCGGNPAVPCEEPFQERVPRVDTSDVYVGSVDGAIPTKIEKKGVWWRAKRSRGE